MWTEEGLVRRRERWLELSLAAADGLLGICGGCPGSDLVSDFAPDSEEDSSGLGAFGGVVVHIPAGAFEVEARGCERTLKRGIAAFGTDELGLSGEVLDFFEAVTALGAAIGIQRQGFSTLPENHAIEPLYRQGGNCLQFAALRSRSWIDREIDARRWERMRRDFPRRG